MKRFKEKFDIENLFITKIGSWTISLRPKQITIGSLILSLDRECPNLGAITKTEGEDLSRTFKVIEDLYKKTFNPDKINYLALMMVDQQVHFHIIPRYSEGVEFDKRSFVDRHWPQPPIVSETYELDKSMVISILNYFKQTVKST